MMLRDDLFPLKFPLGLRPTYIVSQCPQPLCLIYTDPSFLY